MILGWARSSVPALTVSLARAAQRSSVVYVINGLCFVFAWLAVRICFALLCGTYIIYQRCAR